MARNTKQNSTPAEEKGFVGFLNTLLREMGSEVVLGEKEKKEDSSGSVLKQLFRKSPSNFNDQVRPRRASTRTSSALGSKQFSSLSGSLEKINKTLVIGFQLLASGNMNITKAIAPKPFAPMPLIKSSDLDELAREEINSPETKVSKENNSILLKQLDLLQMLKEQGEDQTHLLKKQSTGQKPSARSTEDRLARTRREEELESRLEGGNLGKVIGLKIAESLGKIFSHFLKSFESIGKANKDPLLSAAGTIGSGILDAAKFAAQMAFLKQAVNTFNGKGSGKLPRTTLPPPMKPPSKLSKIAGPAATGVSAALGGYFAYDRYQKGDTFGAGVEAVSGAAPAMGLPGIAAAMGLQYLLTKRDEIKAERQDLDWNKIEKNFESILTITSPLAGLNFTLPRAMKEFDGNLIEYQKAFDMASKDISDSLLNIPQKINQLFEKLVSNTTEAKNKITDTAKNWVGSLLGVTATKKPTSTQKQTDTVSPIREQVNRIKESMFSKMDNMKNMLFSEKQKELTSYLKQQGITDPKTLMAIMGNVQEETGFRLRNENLNYSKQSVESLKERFKSTLGKLPDAEVARIKMLPQAEFAEYIYGNRMGNTQKGDAWKYRGRGYIQLTGKNNYAAASQDLFGDDRLVQNPELVSRPDIAMATTAWYMKKNLAQGAKVSGVNLQDPSLTQTDLNLAATSAIAGFDARKNTKTNQKLSKVNEFTSAQSTTAPTNTVLNTKNNMPTPKGTVQPKTSLQMPVVSETASRSNSTELKKEEKLISSTTPPLIINNNTTVAGTNGGGAPDFSFGGIPGIRNTETTLERANWMNQALGLRFT